LAFGMAAAQAPAGPSVPRVLDVPDNALVAPGKAPEFDLLYTGDVIGYLEDCGCHMNPAGGLARRAWLLNQLMANYPTTPLVLFDTGNFSDNPTESGDLRTAALLQSMKKLGYSAINIGERDLNYGYDDFVKRTESLPMKFISTNIVTQGTTEPAFLSSTIVTIKGTSGLPVRVGVLGVTRYTPVWQKAGPPGTNLGTAPPTVMIAKYLPELRKNSDVVVLLASLAKEDAHDIAKQFQDIDLILGAYAGEFSTVEEIEGRVRIYYTGNQGKRMGESRITLDANRRFADATSYMHFLTAHYPEDKGMKDAIADVVAKTPREELPKKSLPANPQAVTAPNAH
jgi:2',3'-cyclic-nucleotide 2'-phosphodiesterase (5'-nucleotidase family)